MRDAKNTDRLVPKVRFKGFTDDWEQRNISSILKENIFNGIINNPGRNKLKVKDINVVNLYENDYINTDHLNYINVSNNELDKYRAKKGDIFLTRSSLKAEGIAESNILLAKTGNYVFDDHIMKLSIDNKYDSYFISNLLSTPNIRKQFIAKAKTGSMTTIGHKDIENVSIIIPKTIEQTKISKLFFRLNRTLKIQDHKLEQLKLLKKGLLQKMFADENSKAPEIRFNNFNTPWEQRKLGEIMNVTSVKRVHQSDWTNEGIPFYRARDIVALSNNRPINNPLYISNELFDRYSMISGKVKKGDILVTGVGSVGIPLLVTRTPIYFKDGNIIWFQNRNQLDSRFLCNYFFTDSFINYIKSTTGIGTVATFTISTGKKTPIFIPTKKEQNKIGKILYNIDKILLIQEKKLSQLKQVKKFLLQNMFI